MKPAPFAYVKAASLDQVFDLLPRHGDEARVLAGGQSVIPTIMNPAKDVPATMGLAVTAQPGTPERTLRALGKMD